MSIMLLSNFQYNNDNCESKKEQYYSKSIHSKYYMLIKQVKQIVIGFLITIRIP
ncbi:hypothetical protein LV92_00612 [Arenibacter echinorum]|uniref:Uncharacterized protein n=1 Tax=Arenibacter echinorum TaxID=440515 RepID=A0A327RI46_9FLAO|nr:hypothetical protein LV92_00612 [Arenibacter echinorum]